MRTRWISRSWLLVILLELRPTATCCSAPNHATSPPPSSTMPPSSPPSDLPVYKCTHLGKRFLYRFTRKRGGRIVGIPD
nr:hypothetical protein I308_05521 [Cryptococcus tetragattii IND107]